MEKANEWLLDFVDDFNAQFAVPAQDSALYWQAPPAGADFDFLFAVRSEKRTKADGSFIYHGYRFRLLSACAANVRFTLCLSERYGLRAYMDGKYYNVALFDALCDCVSDTMPIVEKELLYRYFYADTHTGAALVG